MKYYALLLEDKIPLLVFEKPKKYRCIKILKVDSKIVKRIKNLDPVLQESVYEAARKAYKTKNSIEKYYLGGIVLFLTGALITGIGKTSNSDFLAGVGIVIALLGMYILVGKDIEANRYFILADKSESSVYKLEPILSKPKNFYQAIIYYPERTRALIEEYNKCVDKWTGGRYTQILRMLGLDKDSMYLGLVGNRVYVLTVDRKCIDDIRSKEGYKETNSWM